MLNTAIVLGGNGLIGQTISNRLVLAGYRVVIADRRPPLVSELGPHLSYKEIDIFSQDDMGALVSSVSPDLLINCVNVATICSHDMEEGYNQLITFYLELYKLLRTQNKSCHYIQIGTTGSGGLGLNIPFTHGENIESLPIINKAAFSGITTSLLTLLSRSFENHKVRVSEIKPGLAIFDHEIKEVYSDAAKLITLDGGESGDYTYAELSLLTYFMGFTSVQAIAQKIEDIINQETIFSSQPSHDIISVLNKTIITSNEDDATQLRHIRSDMKERGALQSIIVTGSLGPPNVSRDLIVAHVVLKNKGKTAALILEEFHQDDQVRATLRYLKSTDRELANYIERTLQKSEIEQVLKYVHSQTEAWEIVRDMLRPKL